LSDRGFNIFIVVVVTIFIMRFTDALIRTIFVLMKRTASPDEAATQRRLQTLSSIFSRVAQSVIFFIGLMTLLQQLNVNVTPILASAGVVGIAVGFGAQSLIRDLFSGFLILLEDQFSVGDVVKIAEFSGTVEGISLRATRVRGLDGSLTTIPNGAINTVSNLSKDWSRIVLDLEIDYTEDVDRAMRLALDTASVFRQELPHELIEEPTMLGVDRISLSTVTIRIVVKTAPARQFDLARELRRRIKNAFQANGIKTPIANPQLLLPEPVVSAFLPPDPPPRR
jgi:small conductance mechanosensitive channel